MSQDLSRKYQLINKCNKCFILKNYKVELLLTLSNKMNDSTPLVAKSLSVAKIEN